MKKLVFTFMMLASISFAASAQNKYNKESKRKADAEAAPDNASSVVKPVVAAQVAQNQTTFAATNVDEQKAKAFDKGLTATQIKTAEQKAAKKTKALQGKLALTKDQYNKLYVTELRYQKMYAQHPEGKVPSGLQANTDAERNTVIRNTLTTEQLKKYEAMQAKTK